MIKRIYFICVSVFFWAATGFASNLSPEKVVELRQSSMKSMVSHVRTLGSIAKGKSTFDLDEVKSAYKGIAKQAEEAVHLFKENKTTPFAEAKADIWLNYGDFSEKAVALEKTAANFFESVETTDDLRESMLVIGQACKSCHSKYRE